MGVTVKSAVWKDELTDVSKKNEEFFVMVGFTKTQSKVFSDGVTLIAPPRKLVCRRHCIPFNKSFPYLIFFL